MSKFIRVDSQGNIQQLQPEVFAAEGDDLQNYILKNPAILGENIAIIANQVDIGAGKQMDVLALEEVSEGIARPVIVELKNAQVGTDTLLQVLRYASWVSTNADSVRHYAEQSKAKFKDIDNSSVKIIIAAPDIKDELLEFSNYITNNIAFGFLEFKRFKDDAGDLLVIDWRSPSSPSGVVSAGQKEWDWERYETELKINPERISIAQYIFDSLVKLNYERGWGLAPVFRKSYIPFKKSGNNVIQIELWTKPCLVISLPKKPRALGLSEIHPDLEQSYDEKYLQYWFRITDISIDIADFADYIEKALETL